MPVKLSHLFFSCTKNNCCRMYICLLKMYLNYNSFIYSSSETFILLETNYILLNFCDPSSHKADDDASCQ